MSTGLNCPDSINVVELDWFAEQETVRVTPRDQMRFDIQKDRAIEILQQEKQAEQFKQQFQFLLSRLGQWIKSRSTKIERAILTLQDNVLLFLIVRKEARYDEKFQDDLAELTIEIANDADLNLIPLKTLALPNVKGEALRSFIDERLTLSYDGKRNRAHKPRKSQS